MEQSFSGKSVQKLYTTSRGGVERRKFPYHLLNRFPVFSLSKSLISRTQLREIELQMVSAISFGWFADFGKTLTII